MYTTGTSSAKSQFGVAQNLWVFRSSLTVEGRQGRMWKKWSLACGWHESAVSSEACCYCSGRKFQTLQCCRISGASRISQDDVKDVHIRQQNNFSRCCVTFHFSEGSDRLPVPNLGPAPLLAGRARTVLEVTLGYVPTEREWTMASTATCGSFLTASPSPSPTASVLEATGHATVVGAVDARSHKRHACNWTQSGVSFRSSCFWKYRSLGYG